LRRHHEPRLAANEVKIRRLEQDLAAREAELAVITQDRYDFLERIRGAPPEYPDGAAELQAELRRIAS